MQVNNSIEESLCDGRSGVGMTERSEVRVLGEAVNHGENDTLPMHARKFLNEIHGDVGPDLGGHLKRLKKTCRM